MEGDYHTGVCRAVRPCLPKSGTLISYIGPLTTVHFLMWCLARRPGKRPSRPRAPEGQGREEGREGQGEGGEEG